MMAGVDQNGPMYAVSLPPFRIEAVVSVACCRRTKPDVRRGLRPPLVVAMIVGGVALTKKPDIKRTGTSTRLDGGLVAGWNFDNVFGTVQVLVATKHPWRPLVNAGCQR